MRKGRLFFVLAFAAAAALAALLFAAMMALVLWPWLYASLATLAAEAAAAAAAAADDWRSVGVTKEDADLLPDRGSFPWPLATCADRYCREARFVLIGGGGGFERDIRLSDVPYMADDDMVPAVGDVGVIASAEDGLLAALTVAAAAAAVDRS